MALEIERKFLVRDGSWKSGDGQLYCQGYLNTAGQSTVRIRTAGERAFLTVKSRVRGATRDEFEYEIPLDDAQQMLNSLCAGPIVEKRRHFVQHANHLWEVDEFLGANAGLVVAEVELESEDEKVEMPAWVGQEVTGDARYYNSNLARHPYREWEA